MKYQYSAFGFPVESTFQLPALSKREETSKPVGDVIKIFEKKITDKLKGPSFNQNQYGVNNERESIFTVPGIAKFSVYNGSVIEVQPLSDNRDDINQQIYASCLAVVLLQRDIILLHCSGVFINEAEVLLFAAPKFTGKSTLSVMLQQKGYLPFTDDTAALTFESDRCYAQASYPSLRLHTETILQQNIYNTTHEHVPGPGADGKCAFHFHHQFTNKKAQVKGIVFLECAGEKLFTEELMSADNLKLLVKSIYRRRFVQDMKKQKVEFDFISNIVNRAPGWKAVRPRGAATFTEFSQMIEENIIHKLIKN